MSISSASTSPAISEVCRSLLSDQRERLNALFLQKKREGAKLDATSWLAHVQRRILPLVDRVYQQLPERAKITLVELYDVSLDLFVLGHFGETTGLLPRVLAQLWEQALPALAESLARDPRRVAGCLSNAVLAIAQAHSDAVERWLQLIQRVGPQTDSVAQLLQVGQVAAWLSGLPQYRAAALPLARALPTHLLQGLIPEVGWANPQNSRSGQNDAALLAQALTLWDQQVWRTVDQPLSTPVGKCQQVAVCGAFRGWGGTFLRPPQVFVVDQQIYATDEQQVWRLQADLFGTALLRCDVAAKINRRKPGRDVPQIDDEGLVHWQTENKSFPHLALPTSQAFDGQTLAVTLADSFHIYLIAQR